MLSQFNSKLLHRLFQIEIVFAALVVTLLDYIFHLEALGVFYCLLAMISAYIFSNSVTFYKILWFVSGLSLLGIARTLFHFDDWECLLNRILIFFTIIFMGIFCKKFFQYRNIITASEKKFSAAITAAPTGYFLLDQKGNLQDFNAMFEGFFSGYFPELSGLNFNEFIHFSTQPSNPPEKKLLQDIPKDFFLKNGKELTFKRQGTPTRSFEFRLVHYSSNEGKFAVGSSWDITELNKNKIQLEQQKENLERAFEELDHFSFIISHDLKAPLRGIKTLAGWLMDDYKEKLGTDGKTKLQKMQDQVQNMSQMIDDVMKFSKAGRENLNLTDVDVAKSLEELIAILSPPENIKIEVEGDFPIIKAVRSQIDQIFQNLISNAIKYMGTKQGKIRLLFEEGENDYKFHVLDEGPGIPKNFQQRIFHIFSSIDANGVKKGSGIGLAVVKKIVELNNGKVLLESEPGKGSKFSFTWPRQPHV